MESTGIKAFFKRKNINFTLRTYFIDAMGAMAFGLFASLLIGTIFATLGEKSGIQVSARTRSEPTVGFTPTLHTP